MIKNINLQHNIRKPKRKDLFNVKKSSIIAVIAAALICSALGGCNDSNSTNKVNIDRTPLMSTVTAQPEKAHFTFLEHSPEIPNTLSSEDKQTIYISSSAEKASFVAESRADREAAKKINATLTQAHERSMNIYDSLIDELEAHLSTENPDMSIFPWETRVDFTCKRNDGRAISVIEEIESYSGKELSGTTTFSYNFEPATGNRIKQVFYDESSKQDFDAADDTMYKKLIAKYGEETINYDNVSSSFVEVAHQCWYFTKDGVEIVFSPGSIAPVEAGTLELEYSKEELPELAQKYFN